jgi:3-dehydroquinate dehydratase/shikimate dehydrogenase
MEYFASTLTREESDGFAKEVSEGIEKDGYGFWAVSAPNVSEFIGFIGLNFLDSYKLDAHFVPAIEVGWRLAHEYWGKGYATEGAKEAIRYAFETLRLNEVVAYTVPSNQRSRIVMEKIGMTYNSVDDFDNPALPVGHPMRRKVLYRISKDKWDILTEKEL